MSAANRDMARALGDRSRELIARSNRIARRSAILVESSQHQRLPTTLVPQCAWCGKIRVGGYWASPDETPGFLGALLPGRRTHGICPECFADVERQAGGAAPLSRTIFVWAGGPLAAECLVRALHDYALHERPNFVLEATLPDAGGTSVSGFLSTVSACLTANELEPVTIQLDDETYVLGD